MSKQIEVVFLRPVYHQGVQYKTGQRASVPYQFFKGLSERKNPLAEEAGKPVQTKSYETKTPQSPDVEATGAGWYSVKIGNDTHKVRGEEALNELLENHANQS